MSFEPRLPDFLIIGAQKAGTRWLRTNLGEHPEVFTAGRELEFFNHNWHLGVDWYARKFGSAGNARAVGEATPGYMMRNEGTPRQAARIDGLLEGVRLIAILRDPVERAYSAFIHHMKEGALPATASLLDHLEGTTPDTDPLQIVAGSLYAESLQPYVDRFSDRLLVLRNEDISGDPVGTYRQVARHIGVGQDFIPDGLGKVRFSNPTPQVSRYADARTGRRPLSVEEHGRLLALVRADTERLGAMFGLSTHAWLRSRI